MSFILRAVMILLVFAFVVYVMKAITRISYRLRSTIKDFQNLREEVGGRGGMASAEMVRCASCGAFVSSRDAFTVSSRNTAQIFCSPECMRAGVLK